MVEAAHLRVPPLPETAKELREMRKIKLERGLLDYTEECFYRLWSDPMFRGYFAAPWHAASKEGDWRIDEVRAADMVRQDAKDHDMPALITEATEATTKAIILALRVISRRHRIDRKTRAGGQPDEVENNDDDQS